MKTSELTGALLDYWVAKADSKGSGMRWEQHGSDWIGFGRIGSSPEFACWIVTDASTLHDRATLRDSYLSARFYSPSTDWSLGGPIIERERINITERDGGAWQAHYSGSWAKHGPTPLVAVMRAYVASKFGYEVPAQEPGEQKG